MLSDLRESGQVEQDADVVMFVYREEYYDKESERLGEADIIFAKHRNGPIGQVTLTFLPKYPRFAQPLPRPTGRGHRRRCPPRATGPADVLRRVEPQEAVPLPVRRVRRLDLDPRRGDQRRPPLPLPRAARAAGRQRRHRHRHREALPRGLVRPRADRLARPGRAAPGAHASCARSTSNLEEGRGLWFDGPVGTGKTSLAILVAKAAKDAGRSYAVYPVPRLLAEIKRTFDRDASDTYLGFFRRLCTVDLLVLDDLGAEKQTEWVLEQLYSIVNERWQDQRSIVVTTQHPRPRPRRPRRACSRRASRDLREAAPERDGRDLEDLRTLRGPRRAGGSPRERARRRTTATTRSCGCASQIGSRTVSRLVEICDDPIPIMGPDLRMAAQGA